MRRRGEEGEGEDEEELSAASAAAAVIVLLVAIRPIKVRLVDAFVVRGVESVHESALAERGEPRGTRARGRALQRRAIVGDVASIVVVVVVDACRFLLLSSRVLFGRLLMLALHPGVQGIDARPRGSW